MVIGWINGPRPKVLGWGGGSVGGGNVGHNGGDRWKRIEERGDSSV